MEPVVKEQKATKTKTARDPKAGSKVKVDTKPKSKGAK